jgi:hypothetical protein
MSYQSPWSNPYGNNNSGFLPQKYPYYEWKEEKRGNENLPKNEIAPTTIDNVRISENEVKLIPLYSTSTYEFGFKLNIISRDASNLETTLGIQFYIKNLVKDGSKDKIFQIGLLGLGIVQWLAPGDGTSQYDTPSINVSYSATIDSNKTSDETIIKQSVSGNNLHLTKFGANITNVTLGSNFYYTMNYKTIGDIVTCDSWLNEERFLTSTEQQVTVKHGSDGKKRLVIKLNSLTISPYLDGNWNIREGNIDQIFQDEDNYVLILWERGDLLYRDEQLASPKTVSCILPDFDARIAPTQSTNPEVPSVSWTLNLTDKLAEIAYKYADSAKKNPVTEDVLELSAYHNLDYNVYVLPIIECKNKRYNVRIYSNNTYMDIIEYPKNTTTEYTLRPDQSMLAEFANIKTNEATLYLYHYCKNKNSKDTIFKYTDDATLQHLNGFIGVDSATFELAIPRDDVPAISNSQALRSRYKPGTTVVDNAVRRDSSKLVYSITDYIYDWRSPGAQESNKDKINYIPMMGNNAEHTKNLPLTDFRKYALITGQSKIGVEAQFTSVPEKYMEYDKTKIISIDLKANDTTYPLVSFSNGDMFGTDFCNESINFVKCSPISIIMQNGRNDSIEESIASGTSFHSYRKEIDKIDHSISMYNYSPPTVQLDVDFESKSDGNNITITPLLKLAISHRSIVDPSRAESESVYTNPDQTEYQVSHTDYGAVTYKAYYKLKYTDGSEDANYYLTNIDGTTDDLVDNNSSVYNELRTDTCGYSEAQIIKKQSNGGSLSSISFEKTINNNTIMASQIDFILIWHDYFNQGIVEKSYPIFINNTANQDEALSTLNSTEVFVDVDITHMGIGIGSDYDDKANTVISDKLTSNINQPNKIKTDLGGSDLLPSTSFKNVIVNWDSVFMREAYFKEAAFFYEGIRINLYPASIGNNSNVTVKYNPNNGQLEIDASSKRYKENIEYDIDTESYHDQFERIKVAKYNYKDSQNNTPKDNTPHNLGFIAEDLDEVNKDLVIYNNDGLPENYKDRDMLALLYLEVKRQNEKIKELEEQIAELLS